MELNKRYKVIRKKRHPHRNTNPDTLVLVTESCFVPIVDFSTVEEAVEWVKENSQFANQYIVIPYYEI